MSRRPLPILESDENPPIAGQMSLPTTPTTPPPRAALTLQEQMDQLDRERRERRRELREAQAQALADEDRERIRTFFPNFPNMPNDERFGLRATTFDASQPVQRQDAIGSFIDEPTFYQYANPHVEIGTYTIPIDPDTIPVKPIEETQSADLLNRITCKVCYSNEIDTVLNCGHMFCGRCVEIILQGDNTCPICRIHIESRVKTFFNKYMKYKNKFLNLRKQIEEFNNIR
jgi:hypothetical protein